MGFFSKHRCPKCNAVVPFEIWMQPDYLCKACGSTIRIKHSYGMALVISVCGGILFAASERFLPAVLDLVFVILLIKRVEIEEINEKSMKSD